MTDNIITITETKEVNISALERKRDEYLRMANEVEFLNVPEYLPDYAEELVREKNSELELMKADMEDKANTIQEEIDRYND